MDPNVGSMSKKMVIKIKVAKMRMQRWMCGIWLGWIKLEMNVQEEVTNISGKIKGNKRDGLVILKK